MANICVHWFAHVYFANGWMIDWMIHANRYIDWVYLMNFNKAQQWDKDVTVNPWAVLSFFLSSFLFECRNQPLFLFSYPFVHGPHHENWDNQCFEIHSESECFQLDWAGNGIRHDDTEWEETEKEKLCDRKAAYVMPTIKTHQSKNHFKASTESWCFNSNLVNRSFSCFLYVSMSFPCFSLPSIIHYLVRRRCSYFSSFKCSNRLMCFQMELREMNAKQASETNLYIVYTCFMKRKINWNRSNGKFYKLYLSQLPVITVQCTLINRLNQFVDCSLIN